MSMACGFDNRRGGAQSRERARRRDHLRAGNVMSDHTTSGTLSAIALQLTERLTAVLVEIRERYQPLVQPSCRNASGRFEEARHACSPQPLMAHRCGHCWRRASAGPRAQDDSCATKEDTTQASLTPYQRSGNRHGARSVWPGTVA